MIHQMNRVVYILHKSLGKESYPTRKYGNVIGANGESKCSVGSLVVFQGNQPKDRQSFEVKNGRRKMIHTI
jgi:hypothetical protein